MRTQPDLDGGEFDAPDLVTVPAAKYCRYVGFDWPDPQYTLNAPNYLRGPISQLELPAEPDTPEEREVYELIQQSDIGGEG